MLKYLLYRVQNHFNHVGAGNDGMGPLHQYTLFGEVAFNQLIKIPSEK